MKRGRPPELGTIPEDSPLQQETEAEVAAAAAAEDRAARWRQYCDGQAVVRRGAAYDTGKDSKREFIIDLCCGTATSATLFHWGENAFILQTQDEESKFLAQVGRLVRGLRPRSPAVPRALVLGQIVALALRIGALDGTLMCT